jgi:patatin-like phospholipase/acyl hydrolase
MAYRVLSIDGGGVRGVGAAHMLCALDEALRAKGKGGVADNFDLLVGTSTGSIIAAGLAASGEGKLSPAGIKQLYYDRAGEMFTRALLGLNPFGIFRGQYKQAAKGRVLREFLGDLTLGSLQRNFMATFYNVGAGPGPVFAHGGASYRDAGDADYDALKLWQVVNASSSAPLYFDPSPVEGLPFPARGVDGGLFANNPAMCAYVEARELWKSADILVASFGCGQQSISYPRRRHWAAIEWVAPQTPLLEAIFDGQSQAASHEMTFVTDAWYRFEFGLGATRTVKLDDTRRESLDRIVEAADAFLATPEAAAQMKALVDVL